MKLSKKVLQALSVTNQMTSDSAETKTGLSFPKIYHKFTAKSCISDNLTNYVVQDLPEERFDDAINFMVSEFLPDEPLCVAIGGLSERPGAIEEVKGLWRKVVKEICSTICLSQESDEIVAINFHVVISKNEQSNKVEVILRILLVRNLQHAVIFVFKN